MGRWKKPPGRELTGKHYDDELARIHWREFERVMGRWYTLQGYEVEERGTQSGTRLTDGGVDLVLKGRGEKVLVQCKHEKVLQVPHNAAMQLRGLIHAEEADRAILVTTGEFTPEALRKAAKAGRLELIDGEAVRRMLGAELPRLRDATWVRPAAPEPEPEAWGRLVPPIDHVARATEPARHVVSRPMSSKLAAYTLLAVVVVSTVVATMGVRLWGRSPPSPPAIADPTMTKPVAAAPATKPAEKRPTERKPLRHVASTTRPKAKVAAPESAPATAEVIYKSADMSDAEFEAWKLRKARREGMASQDEAEAVPTGPATPAQTMQVILRTNRH
ncbi:restriction endonuclease [Luteibacter sp. SG786]|uniref:restriction endonuclease n=1 Tax=Luteibacter sp. SG786 TaxID=2587130 RepID=UPI00141E3729|nr:restriction endonuclease [Luteibacter sp. SG786]NII55695.1 hypothetical protein [Luteibacter sp. SG786]